MPIKYQIVDELSLLCTVFYDTVDRDEAFNYVHSINNDAAVGNVTRSIIVLKESRLVFNIEDVESFSRKLAISNCLKRRNKIALLIESPNDTVMATIFAQTIQTIRKGVVVELFYTLDAALQFLTLVCHKNRVEEAIARQLQGKSEPTRL